MPTPFANHQIHSQVQAEGFHSWLLKSANGGSEYWVRITAADRLLTVVGDFEPTVFAYGPENPVACVHWMGTHQTVDSYVYEKACIGTGRDHVTKWDPDQAREDLRKIVDEFKIDNKGDEDDPWVVNALAAFQAGLDVYNDWMGVVGVAKIQEAVLNENPDLSESIGEIGQRPAYHVQLALEALNRLVELLNEQEPSETPAA